MQASFPIIVCFVHQFWWDSVAMVQCVQCVGGNKSCIYSPSHISSFSLIVCLVSMYYSTTL